MKGKQSIALLLIPACIFLINNSAMAERALPKFGNFWYTNAKSNTTLTTCTYNATYLYTDKSDSAIGSMNSYVQSLPKHTDCVWQPPTYQHDEAYLQPLDFPGSATLWSEVKQQAKELPQYWEEECKNTQGMVIDSRVVDVYPSYTCPDGYIFYSPDNGAEEGCYPIKDRTVCSGDIVGRLLDYKHLAKYGHVGIVLGPGIGNWSIGSDGYAYNNVAEVLRDSEVIHDADSLNDFKNKVPGGYWGAKYQVNGYPPLTWPQAAELLMPLGIQKEFNDKHYTMAWNWHPGGYLGLWGYDPVTDTWRQSFIMVGPVFRCDSFVYYIYKAGTQEDIVPPGPFSPHSPLQLFNALQMTRELGVSRSFSRWINQQVDPQQQVAAIFAQSDFSVTEADDATYNYISSQLFDRTVKINFLWSLAVKYCDNEIKFCYLADLLAKLQPVELAKDIIYNYGKQKSAINKAHIILLLTSSIYYESLSEAESLTSAQIQDVVLIQNFLKQLMLKSKNIRVLRSAVVGYTKVVPPELSYQALLVFMKRKDIQANKVFSPHELRYMYVELALSNPNMRNSLLPKVLLRAKGSNDSADYAKIISFFLSQMPATALSSPIKTQLARFLLAHKQAMLKSNVAFTPLPYQWLTAYARIKADSKAERLVFEANYILQHMNDQEFLLNIMPSLGYKVLTKLPEKERAVMLDNIEHYGLLNHGRLKYFDRYRIKFIITKLREQNKQR